MLYMVLCALHDIPFLWARMTVIKEQPITTRTDRMEIRIFIQAGVIRFHRLRICMQEITVDPKPLFTLNFKDFLRYEKTWESIARAMLIKVRKA